MDSAQASVAIVVLLFCSGFVLLLWLVVRQRRLNRVKRHRAGLLLLASMRLLLANVQKHRGLTNGFLRGSSQLLGEITDLQNVVSRNFHDISLLDTGIEDDGDWQGVTQHWARLAGNFRRLDPENNFVQHNRLVKNIIQMIDRIVQEYGLGNLRNQQRRPFEAYISELLTAVEAVGRVRAVGTGVAAAGICDERSRSRLQYLCNQIEETFPSLQKNLVNSEQVINLLQELVDTARTDMLCKTPRLGPDEYFSVASKAFDALSLALDASLRDAYWY